MRPKKQNCYKPAIKIASWNIHGLFSKECDKTKDQMLIKSISDKDIVILTETKCSNSDTIHVPNYYCYSLNRTPLQTAKTHSGGIAFLCKQELKQGIAILAPTSEDYFWVKLKKSFFNINQDLYICAIYNPPPSSTYSVRQHIGPLEKIEEDIIKYSKIGDIMLMGDINARTSNAPDYICGDSDIAIPIYIDDTIPPRNSLDRVLDNRGKHLLEICIQSHLCILNGRCLGDTLGNFTCHNYNGSSVVDYSIVSETLYKNIIYFNVEKFNGSLSDHCMINTLLEIQKPINIQSININLHKIERTHIKWTEETKLQYTNNLSNTQTESEIQKLKLNCTSNNINETICSLSKILIKQIPKKQSKYKTNRQKCKKYKNQNKWYNLKKILVRKGISMSENPYDKNLRLSFYYFRKKYRKECKIRCKKYKSELIAKLEKLQYENPRQYWKLLNELLENNTNKIDPSTTISPGDWYDYLFNLKTDGTSSIIENDLNIKLQEMEQCKVFNELDYAITEKEVTNAIAKLKNNKTPGLDEISNEMLKNLTIPAKALITKVFNNILLSGMYPNKWNKGYVTAIHKSKTTTDPNNYRCLTINSSFGKLFNRILNERLTSYLEKHQIISPCQIGFQTKKQTSDHIYTLHTIVKKYTKMYKKKLYACFIDLKKAFDTVWHSGLMYKLQMIGISSNFYRIIKCMYTENEVCMKFKDQITDFFTSTIGVKQGDNLSSTLFNIYINDLTNCFTNSCDPIQIGSSKIHCLMYADDIILLSESASGLANQLRIVSEFCQAWKLSVNTDKSKIMIFEARKSNNTHNFMINSQNLEQVYSYKYLGVIIDYKGNFTECKLDLLSRSQKAYFKLRKLLNTDIINPKLYLSIFDRTVLPIMTYGSEIWGYFNVNTKRYLQNKSPEYLYEECIAEKLHMKLCKILLGVNQKATNIACRSELGRYPIMINILTNIVCYRARLEKDDCQGLVKESFRDDMLMHSKGLSDWYTCSEEILKYVNISKQQLQSLSVKRTRQNCTRKLRLFYDYYFRETLFNDNRNDPSEKSKLRTFRLFKNTIKYEPYLSLRINKNIIKKYTQLRLSAHKLRIETSRYIKAPSATRTQEKLSARICKNCTLNKDETELHFLLECPKYDRCREEYLKQIIAICPNITNLSLENKLIWLLSNEDTPVMIRTINFVNECFNLRVNT